LLISKEDSVTITVFNKVSITIAMLPNKTKIINNCVSRYKKNLTNREVMFTCIIIAAQVVANAHVYKQTNVTFIKATKLKKKSKSRQKRQNNKTRILNK